MLVLCNCIKEESFSNLLHFVQILSKDIHLNAKPISTDKGNLTTSGTFVKDLSCVPCFAFHDYSKITLHLHPPSPLPIPPHFPRVFSTLTKVVTTKQIFLHGFRYMSEISTDIFWKKN